MAGMEPSGLTKLRNACLARGVHGIKNFGRTFRIYDDDGSKALNYDEFKSGVHDYGVRDLTERELRELFIYFDKDGSGSIIFDEFLISLRPRMSKARVELVKKAFIKLDRTGDGKVTIDDIKLAYNADFHPKYKSGEWTKKKVFQEFLNIFQADGDATVTWEEFLNYYSGVSASVDLDVYFDLMMRQAWKI